MCVEIFITHEFSTTLVTCHPCEWA